MSLMCKMNSSKGLKSYLIFSITISLQLLQLSSILAGAMGEENSIDYQQYSIGNIASPRGRLKRFVIQTCEELPLGPLARPYYRNRVMVFLNVYISETAESVKATSIDTSEYQEFKHYAEQYEYLKSVKPDVNPNFSEWYHIMQSYEYTFDSLLNHQKQTGNLPQIQKDLEVITAAVKSLVCSIQLAAIYIEKPPTFKLLTDAEKKFITDKLRTTDRKAKNADEIDLMFAKVLFNDLTQNMMKSLATCIDNCDCVKGRGECDLRKK